MASQPPRVFISYSQDSAERAQRVLALCGQLRMDGVDAQIDQYVHGTPEEGWPRWMRNQVSKADRVLLVFTGIYARRFLYNEDQGKGLGVTFEGVIISQALYENAHRNAKFRSVVFTQEDEKFIPAEFRPFNYYRVDTPENYEKLLRWLYEVPQLVSPTIGQIESEQAAVV
jgi:hypothetical protein